MLPYNYIVIEGNIGAGKSTLSSLMADDFNATLVHESFADNPFLAEFYKNPEKNVFPLETSFLAERFLQLKNVFEQPDLFRPMVISDYIFHKSLIFATQNLKEPEITLFRKLFEIMEASLPKPDVMIYLHRSTTDLQHNIRKRGREYEQAIQNEYLELIKQGYFEFFKTVNAFPILMINMDGLSFLGDRNNYHKLIKILEIGRFKTGLNVVNI